MKIVCDNCATKYSIADEKVRGKVFKIRCKKCSHIIVVRGNEGAPVSASGEGEAVGDGFPGDEPPTTVAGGQSASDAVWHLVVDREQIGPLTAQEVRGKFSAGEIDVETYAWREGFGDWLRLGSIDDFRDLGAAAAPSHGGEGATRRTDGADLFAQSGQDEASADAGSDLFGSASAKAGQPAAQDSYAASGGAGGLFGAPESSPAPSPRASRTSSPGFSGSGHGNGNGSMAAGGASAEAADSSRPMTGQRNENSVLFSLNNLQALASGGGPPRAAASESAPARPGFASSQTEGSGLIDIRAMAASTLAASPTGPSSSKDDVGGQSFSAPPIFSPMAAPILMPAVPSGPPKWMWPVLGVGVVAVIGIVVVGVLLIRKSDGPTVVAGGPTNPASTGVAPSAAPVAAAAAVPAAAAAPAAPTEAPKATAPAEPKEEKGGGKHAAKHEPKVAAAASAPKHEPKAEAPAAAPAPAAEAPKPKGKKGDALDDLLNAASPDKGGGGGGGGSAAPKHAAHEEASGGDDNLPDQLDKASIVGGMGKVKARVQGCYDQYKVPGVVSIAVTIGHSGSVQAASASGSFSGTPTGSCVEKAVKSASFPKFKGAAQTITYPFMLR